MKKVPLGNTGEEISVLGLGTMYFGTKVDERMAFRLMDMYVDLGGNMIDTANKYASWMPGFQGGESEKLIGKWLQGKSGAEDLIIASKVGFPYGEIPRSLKSEIIVAECERSLQRLGIETIDLYYAHAYDAHTQIEETMEAFHRLKKEGKIRYAGASNYPAWRLEEANTTATAQGWEGYCCLQQRHTYLEPLSRARFGNQEFLTPELEDLCEKRNITIIGYSGLLKGAYARQEPPVPEQYHSPLNDQRLEVLQSLSRQTGYTVNQLVLAWMIRSTPPVVPLFSASNEDQLKENLASAEIVLSDESDWDLMI